MRVVLIARRKSSIVFDWLKVSFAVFKQKPSTWMAIFALHTLAMLLAQFVPVLGVFFMLLAPYLAAGVVNCANMSERGESYNTDDFFQPFKQKEYRGPFLQVSAIQIGLGLIVAFCSQGLVQSMPAMAEQMKAGEAVTVPVEQVISFIVPYLFVTAASYFLVPLVYFHKVKGWEAVKLSLTACMRNLPVMLVLLLIVFTLLFISGLTFMLGLLIAGPVILIVNYVAFRSLFAVRHASDESVQEIQQNGSMDA